MILQKLILLLAILIGFTQADDNWKPSIKTNAFQSVRNILYFDDSPVLLLRDVDTVYRSENDGQSWVALELRHEDGSKAMPTEIYQTEFDNQFAVIMTKSNRQFYSKDQGRTWEYFDLDIKNSAMSSVEVNYANHDLILFSFYECEENGWQTNCYPRWYYSKDGLATAPEKMPLDNLVTCHFTKSNKAFTVGDDQNIMCIERENDSFGISKSSRVISSSDFFKTALRASNPALDNSHVLKLQVVQSFVILIVQSDRYTNNGFIDFYVSKDGFEFKKAFFESQVRSWMFNILPSSPQSLHIAIYGAKNSMDKQPAADIYQSDSTGTFFDKVFGDIFTNQFGYSDITKVQEIDGVWIASHNVGTDPETRMINARSKITFNDGKTWNYLKMADDDSCKGDEECSLNLVYLTERSGDGKVVSGPTPGILVGMGNTGTHISHDYHDYKTFISRDGGLTWRKALETTSIFAFGDLGNIIVTIPVTMDFLLTGKSDTLPSSFQYSLDQGNTFKTVDLGVKVLPFFVMTTIDGSSQHLIIVGLDDTRRSFVTAIDFSGAFKRDCGPSDYEGWYARVDGETHEPICVYGHREKFMRRKQDADCFVNTLYEDIEVIEEPCVCSIDDTECEVGFRKDENDVCQPIMSVIAHYYCDAKNSNSKIKLTSSRMIPGSVCKREGGYTVPKDDVTIDCREAIGLSKESKIKTKVTQFQERVAKYLYLNADPKPGNIPDETLLVLTENNNVFVSYDGGLSFEPITRLIIDQGKIISILTNPYFPNHVYVLTSSNKLYISKDRAISFEKFDTPSDFNVFANSRLSFNKKNPDKFIWYGETGCRNIFSSDCKVEASVTQDGGKTFTKLLDNVRSCRFVGSILNHKEYDVSENLILCDQSVSGADYFRLVSTTDYFASDPVVLFEKIIGSTETGEFIVVARLNDDSSLTAFVSVDGAIFAEAKFPQDLQVTTQTAYTILDVTSEQIFMHVTTNRDEDAEYGALLKSNYNGTLYVKSADNVNRNKFAYVDFESVQGIEGISLLNIVANTNEVKENGASKELKTKISHNDGAEWSYLSPPVADSNGKKYSCNSKSLDECSLNLHSYTEREDPTRDTYSSGSAIGMMFGVGNVGRFMKSMEDEDTATFFTRDGGITWKEVAKGKYMWEFGDQGTILIMVKEGKSKSVTYSLDEGDTWQEYQFSEKEVEVWDIATVPSDTARRFMLMVRDEDKLDSAYTLDFSRVQERQCYLDLDDASRSDDFEYWTPKHPFQADNCLFGHEAHYLRRSPYKTDCFIGAAPLSKGYQQLRNCTCSRRDFECDYNYAISYDGTCKLISGLSPIDGKSVCNRDPDAVEWWEPTGYRKVPMSTCNGGLELDKWVSHACSGKQDEYDKKHNSGLHGATIFWVIAIPIFVFLTATIFVYDRGIRRNGGFARFGEIRLDDDDDLHLIEENRVDVVVNKIVLFGVYSFGFMASLKQKLSTFLKRGIFSRFRSDAGGEYTRFTTGYNDRIADDEDESLFRYNTDDDDAREIDSFLEHGITNDVGDDEEDSEDFTTNDDVPVQDSNDFRLDDDDDGDLGR